jgi:hypothetical protein
MTEMQQGAPEDRSAHFICALANTILSVSQKEMLPAR